MKSNQSTVAQSLEASLKAFKIPVAPVPKEQIFPEKSRPVQTLLLKLTATDIAAIEAYLMAGRAAGRPGLNTTQAIRAMLRTAPFKLSAVDDVINEDPRRKRRGG